MGESHRSLLAASKIHPSPETVSQNAALRTSVEYSAIRSPLGDAGASYFVSQDQLRVPSSFHKSERHFHSAHPILLPSNALLKLAPGMVSTNPSTALVLRAVAHHPFLLAPEASTTGLPAPPPLYPVCSVGTLPLAPFVAQPTPQYSPCSFLRKAALTTP